MDDQIFKKHQQNSIFIEIWKFPQFFFILIR